MDQGECACERECKSSEDARLHAQAQTLQCALHHQLLIRPQSSLHTGSDYILEQRRSHQKAALRILSPSVRASQRLLGEP